MHVHIGLRLVHFGNICNASDVGLKLANLSFQSCRTMQTELLGQGVV